MQKNYSFSLLILFLNIYVNNLTNVAQLLRKSVKHPPMNFPAVASQNSFLIDAVTSVRLVKSQKFNMISMDYLCYKDEKKQGASCEKYKSAFDGGPASHLPFSCSFCWEEQQFINSLNV